MDDPSGFGAYVSPVCNGPLATDPKCGSPFNCGECRTQPAAAAEQTGSDQ